MSQDVVTAGYGASEVIFTSDTDPFGGYFSGWQTLLTFALFFLATVVLTRRNGRPVGRIAFFLGLVVLGMVQVVPYLLQPVQIPLPGVTFVWHAWQWLVQVTFIIAFWLPVFWLTAAPGKRRQKLLIALSIGLASAMPMPIYYALSPYKAGIAEIGETLLPTAIIAGVLIMLHLAFIVLAPLASGAQAKRPDTRPA